MWQGEGGEQGDALMPALFSLALASSLKRAQARLRPDEVLLAYLDDLYLVTRPERVGAAYLIVTDEVRDGCGIEPNLGKTVSWNRAGVLSPKAALVLPPGAWKGGEGIRVLGAPLGTPDFCKRFGEEQVAKATQLAEAVARLPRQQHAWLLHYFCVVPRANHLLRQVPPSTAAATAQAQDRLTADGLCRLLGAEPGSLPAGAERQARLPLRFGGLGLRDSSRTSPAAFWASWADSLPTLSSRFPWFGAGLAARLQADPGDGSAVQGVQCLEELQQAKRLLAEEGNLPTWGQVLEGARPADLRSQAAPGEWKYGWQAVVSDAREQQDLNNLLAAAPAPDCARLRSCGGGHNAAWLTTAPTSAAFRLSNAEHKFLMRFRLGLPALAEGGFCIGKHCRCRLDAYGYHSVCCMRSGRPQVRHSLACSGWRQILQEAGYRVHSERLLRDTCVVVPPACKQRMDLVAVPKARGTGARRGAALFCDVTIACPLSGMRRPKFGSAEIDGAAVAQAVNKHEETYAQVSDPACLVVLGAETFGRWAPEVENLMQELAYHKADMAPSLIRHDLARIWQERWWALASVGVQRALAQSVLCEHALDMLLANTADIEIALEKI